MGHEEGNMMFNDWLLGFFSRNQIFSPKKGRALLWISPSTNVGEIWPIVRFHELDGDDEIPHLCWFYILYYLVGGAMCPSWKMMEFVNGFRMTSHIWNGKKKPYLKPPTSYMYLSWWMPLEIGHWDHQWSSSSQVMHRTKIRTFHGWSMLSPSWVHLYVHDRSRIDMDWLY